MTEPPSKATLLVVDDEQEICTYAKRYFELKGYQVLTALSGPEALVLVQQHHPQLILLDIKMHGWTGLETLKRIRAVDPKVPVIMLTRVDEPADRETSKRLGAAEYLVKPISLQQQEAIILKYLTAQGGPRHG